ncbi:hypothetical protein FA13DRAFT_1786197 [Coprinellus micaceus]|uniref:Uncharacterized protein n=1 Tax=Coprinellus micaceus TaxID=71717 RepID=A0A4Y7TW77_COPMI|nr:hypothetical protein FA13DRAFT_1786197 [Coprinellus micaceus]
MAHKVWILDCKSCGLFLTNRAMKAVLLLRPNVSLYSSDAMPVNCSAYFPPPDDLGESSACRPAPSRTCDCLTQTLSCHGCGNPIGYTIVTPCTRCTSSISSSNRATNGHRFVFHSSEIVGTERHYVPNEPGVTPYEPIAFIPQPIVAPSQNANPYPSPPRDTPSSPFPPPHVHPFTRPTSPSEFPPTPPLEYTYLHYPPVYHPTPGPHSSRASTPPGHADSASLGYDHKEQPFTPRKLKAGDILFWHHLTRSGEIPGMHDDERARYGPSPFADNVYGIVFDR